MWVIVGQWGKGRAATQASPIELRCICGSSSIDKEGQPCPLAVASSVPCPLLAAASGQRSKWPVDAQPQLKPFNPEPAWPKGAHRSLGPLVHWPVNAIKL